MFCNRTDFTDKLAWDSLVLVVLSQVIKLLSLELDRGCIDFSCVLKPEIKKMVTLKKKNGDPFATQKLKEIPMRTRSRKCIGN